MIIYSTKLSTAAAVIEIYGGTTWISHSGYMLRGATSSVVANSATKTGGADSVSYTPAASGGNVGNCTLTLDQIPSHTHAQNAHSHNPHAGVSTYFVTAGETGTSNYYLAYNTTTGWGGANIKNVTASATATNKNAGGGKAHTHSFTGAAATINTLPQYKNVYIWERTA